MPIECFAARSRTVFTIIFDHGAPVQAEPAERRGLPDGLRSTLPGDAAGKGAAHNPDQ